MKKQEKVDWGALAFLFCLIVGTAMCLHNMV